MAGSQVRRLPWTGAVLLLSALFYLDPRRLLPSFLFAVLAHELGHLLALRLCGVRAQRFSLTARGAVLFTPVLPWRQQIICCLAGPLAGFAFAWAVTSRYPLAAALSAILSLYNLLPLEPLDGGQALRALTAGLLPAAAHIWLTRVQTLLTYLFWIACFIYGVLLHRGVVPLMLASSILIQRAYSDV